MLIIMVFYSIMAFAWFSEQLVNVGNRIAAGSYMAQMELSAEFEEDDLVKTAEAGYTVQTSTANIISELDLPAGQTSIIYIKLSNPSLSKLDYKYKLELTLPEEVTADFQIVTTGGTKNGSLFEQSALAVGESDIYRIEIENISEQARLKIDLKTNFVGSNGFID